MEEVGYVLATDVQREALPALFSGRDCVLHAQVDLLFAIDSSFLLRNEMRK